MESHHIHKLDEITINRIAAGEIIQRPSGVVKELIENSIDAGSTAIIVTSSGGGMDTLQIQDNGCGIYKSDMEIVCERFTTSKISTFDDLKTVTTFGFRGEALASISHVSRVTISSKTKNEQCAYKAKYCDGKMIPFKQGENIQLKACAGNIGTTILVEDLFYNMLNRRLAFSNHNDEHQRVVDVVVKYAVHYGDKHISFTCKKPKSQSPDFHLSANTSISTLHAIQIAYGAALAKELLLLSDFSTSDTISSRYDCTLQTTKADVLNYTVHGYLSNSNFSKKKGIFILFINNRLVESQNIKKLIESVYNEFLPKNTYPFVYLSICLPPEHVDVNVHPTKKEVHFLHEEELLECLLSRTQALLRNSNDSRVFYLQPTLQQFSQSNKGGQEIWETGTGNYDDQIISSKRKHEDIIEGIVDDERSNIQSQAQTSSTMKEKRSNNTSSQQKQMVRTDPKMLRIDNFFQHISRKNVSESKVEDNDAGPMCLNCGTAWNPLMANISTVNSNNEKQHTQYLPSCHCIDAECLLGKSPGTPSRNSKLQRIVDAEINPKQQLQFKALRRTSCANRCVQAIVDGIEEKRTAENSKILKNCSLVGVIDNIHALIQVGIKLILVDYSNLLFHLFYQMALCQLENLKEISLVNHLCIKSSIRVALDSEEALWEDGDGDKDDISSAATAILISNKAFLFEYFKIGINDDGYLYCIPDLIENYMPLPESIPLFLLRLATQTDWSNDEQVFLSVANELALFFMPMSVCDNNDVTSGIKNQNNSKWEVVYDVLFPALRLYLVPHDDFLNDGTFVVVANLENLYKIFERC